MTREIKFRAWDNKENKMRDDFSINSEDGSPESIYVDSDYEAEVLNVSHYKVMQYTGLKDINGIEIYEGDIVNEFGFYSRAIVKFGEYKRKEQSNHDRPQKNQGFYLKSIKYTGAHNLIYDFGEKSILDTTNGVEIIGNIYKNPELIKNV